MGQTAGNELAARNLRSILLFCETKLRFERENAKQKFLKCYQIHFKEGWRGEEYESRFTTEKTAV